MERIGKKLRIIFYDGEKISSKVGTVTSEDQDFIVLNKKDYIPKREIKRMEVQQ